MQRIGELSMEVELLRSRIERPGPFGSQEVAVMAATRVVARIETPMAFSYSPSGIRRSGPRPACQVWPSD